MDSMPSAARVSAAGVPPSSSTVLAQQLFELLRPRWETQPNTRVVVAVAGESGSGKTATARKFALACEQGNVRTVQINQDNYFHLPPRTNHEQRAQSLSHVGPHEVNLALISEHIAAFRAGVSEVAGPLVDYPGNRFTTQTLSFADATVLVVEGTYVLQLESIDVRVFLQATHHETEVRRKERNRDIDDPFVTQVLAIEHDIISRQAAVADVMVDAEFRIVRGA